MCQHGWALSNPTKPAFNKGVGCYNEVYEEDVPDLNSGAPEGALILNLVKPCAPDGSDGDTWEDEGNIGDPQLIRDLEASEPARLWICASYFHYSVPDGFTAPEGLDLSPYPGRSDPVYAVSARKVPTSTAGKSEL